MNRLIRRASAGLAVGLILLAVKGTAWWVTGSAAFYADALQTAMALAAAVVGWWALGVASQPADSNHPYGHDKAEFLASVVEGVLIIVAALLILQHAWVVFWHPHPLGRVWLGVALDGGATVATLALFLVLSLTGGRQRSSAWRTTGLHLMASIASGCSAGAGVALMILTGRLWVDPLAAAATAAYVLWSGMHLIGESVGGLMDMAPADGTLERIAAVLKAQGHGAIEAHDVRTRQAAQLTFVQFHLVVPGKMRVAEAHDICDRIEAALKAEMSHLVVNIHVEPEYKAKHEGVLMS